MLRRTLVLGGALSVILYGAGTLASQNPTLPTDHLTGTWILNAAQSKYNPAEMAMKSNRVRITVTQAGIKLTSDGVNGAGETTHAEYTAKFDGKDYKVTSTVAGKPDPNQDAVSWKQVDEWNYEITNKLKGKATTTIKCAISKDGKTGTLTVTGTGATGQPVNSTVIYNKQ
jgi:uncharacterized membrane protein YdfJ with MMPL/SSD domain